MAEPIIVDVHGTQRDWAWLTGKYGRLEHRRGAGYPCFELVRIEETIGPASLKVKLIDASGAPVGALVALTYPDLRNPANFLQDLMQGDPAKSQWSSRGAVQFTDGMTGMTGFGLGGDSWIRDLVAGGPYHVWPYHTAIYADCLSWIGWLGGTDHAGPCSLVFQLVQGGTPDPDPDPDPEPPSDFEAHVIALLTRIATGIEHLSAHLGA
jgi:hypothetical protein